MLPYDQLLMFDKKTLIKKKSSFVATRYNVRLDFGFSSALDFSKTLRPSGIYRF